MSMTSEQLLNDLAARDVVLTVDGGQLRVDAPSGVLTEELRRTLGERKPQLVELIRHRPGTPGGKPQSEAERIAAMTLTEFSTSGLILRVRSEVLGCTIIFAADNASPGVLNRLGLPVYRPSELRKLAMLRPPPRALQTIHDAKTIFHGEISDAETE